MLSTFSSTVELALTQIQLMPHLMQHLMQHLRQHLMPRISSDAETRPEFGLGLGYSLPFLSLIVMILKNVVEGQKRESWRRGKMFFCHEGNGFSGFVSTAFRQQE